MPKVGSNGDGAVHAVQCSPAQLGANVRRERVLGLAPRDWPRPPPPIALSRMLTNPPPQPYEPGSLPARHPGTRGRSSRAL